MQIHFSTLTGRGVRVAVVDSGIDPAHPKIGRIAGGVDLSVGPEGQVVCGTDFTDRAGHGTACAGIILKKAPEAELYSVRIFDESLSANGQALVAAVRWATAQDVDVVNLSLGTTDVIFRDAIAEACREAVRVGGILVAAEHNGGLESYPAALPEVIGVTGGKIYDRYGYYYRPGEVIECVARGDEQRLCWLNGQEIMMGGTSFAAPHIAGIVALIREAHPRATLKEVREILKANALEVKECPGILSSLPLDTGPAAPTRGKRTIVAEFPSSEQGWGRDLMGASGGGGERIEGTDAWDSGMYQENRSLSGATEGPKYEWIKRAALYPYNKEMHAFIRFRDLLGFEIVGAADPAGKGLVGKDAGEAIGIAPAGIRIRPRLQDALRDADTLILGYVDQLGSIAKRDLLRESIQTALEKGAHVFSFFPVFPGVYSDLYATARKKGLNIVYPSISTGEVQSIIRKGQTGGAVDAPVLGVFGTSSQQGKFTVQLALRRKLMRMGYQVGQIGTEHHTELFGMDFAFPMGYASPLDLSLQWYVPYLDHKMREICRQKRPDIILVGSQSGTIPYDVHEHNTHSMPSIAFLLGTRPDACILVVNSIDPDDYIRDTIDAVRAMGKAPTILLAMSDKEKHIRAAYGRTSITPRQMCREEIDQKLQHLEETFKLPAVEILSEQGQQRMVEAVIQHFADSHSSENREEPCRTKQA